VSAATRSRQADLSANSTLGTRLGSLGKRWPRRISMMLFRSRSAKGRYQIRWPFAVSAEDEEEDSLTTCSLAYEYQPAFCRYAPMPHPIRSAKQNPRLKGRRQRESRLSLMLSALVRRNKASSGFRGSGNMTDPYYPQQPLPPRYTHGTPNPVARTQRTVHLPLAPHPYLRYA